MDKYKISVGESRAAVSWPVKQTGWAQLAARLGKCKRTHETVADYKAMTKTQRGKVKDDEVRFILDIDIFMSGNVPVNTCVPALNTVHIHADRIFAGAMTRKLHEAMEPSLM